jgi:hypothetical protein
MCAITGVRAMRILQTRRVWAALVGVALIATGCGSRDPIPATERAVLEEADTLEVFALDPSVTFLSARENEATVGFHGWPILKRKKVDDSGTREEVAAAVVRGWRKSEDEALHCFDPRHGIRARRGDQTADFVICFACRSVEVYSGSGETGGFLTADSARELLDRLLQDGTVPEDPKARP